MKESSLISKSVFEVTSHDTDMEARLRLGSMVNFLIQSAIKSADSLGFGFGGIKGQQLFWVLSRLPLEIYRPLKWYEKLEVETWPKNVEKILYLRDYIVRDADSNIVAKATSGWLAVDFESHRAKKIEGVHAELFSQMKEMHALPELPKKLEAVETGASFEFKTSYYDIDLNKHLSATRYIDRMMDSFPVDFHLNHYPSALSVNFLKETMPGETLNFTRRECSDNKFAFEAVNVKADVSAFRGLVEFGFLWPS
jgi:medium-chain acyl-[acyl-carrier-protein] hydrolase